MALLTAFWAASFAWWAWNTTIASSTLERRDLNETMRHANQDGQVMVESFDKMWLTGEGNGKPLQYSCLENPMEQWIGLKLVKEYIKAMYCHPAYLTYIERTPCEMSG